MKTNSNQSLNQLFLFMIPDELRRSTNRFQPHKIFLPTIKQKAIFKPFIETETNSTNPIQQTQEPYWTLDIKPLNKKIKVKATTQIHELKTKVFEGLKKDCPLLPSKDHIIFQDQNGIDLLDVLKPPAFVTWEPIVQSLPIVQPVTINADIRKTFLQLLVKPNNEKIKVQMPSTLQELRLLIKKKLQEGLSINVSENNLLFHDSDGYIVTDLSESIPVSVTIQ